MHGSGGYKWSQHAVSLSLSLKHWTAQYFFRWFSELFVLMVDDVWESIVGSVESTVSSSMCVG